MLLASRNHAPGGPSSAWKELDVRRTAVVIALAMDDCASPQWARGSDSHVAVQAPAAHSVTYDAAFTFGTNGFDVKCS
jgi:hypothetical protein